MSCRIPGADESASSMTTASLGSISPIACRSARGCTGVVPASPRAFALSASRSAAIAALALPSRSGTARHALTDGSRDLGQRRLHVAENGDGRRIVLAELPWIDIEMNELDIRR